MIDILSMIAVIVLLVGVMGLIVWIDRKEKHT